MRTPQTLNFALALVGLCESSLLPYAANDWTPNIRRSDPTYSVIAEALDLMKRYSHKVPNAPSLMTRDFREVWKAMTRQPDFWLAAFSFRLEDFAEPISLASGIGPETLDLARAVLKGNQPLFDAEARGFDVETVELHDQIDIHQIAKAYVETTTALTESRLIVLAQPPIVVAEDWDQILAQIHGNSEVLYRLDWKRFEDLVGHLLQSFGWTIEPMGYTKDGGIDIVAVRKIEPGIDFRMMVQCKRLSAQRKVGIQVIRELWAVKSQHAFNSAMLATTSVFTKGAIEGAELWNLELKDHSAIASWCRNYNARKRQLDQSTSTRTNEFA